MFEFMGDGLSYQQFQTPFSGGGSVIYDPRTGQWRFGGGISVSGGNGGGVYIPPQPQPQIYQEQYQRDYLPWIAIGVIVLVAVLMK